MPSGVHTYSPATAVGTDSGLAVWSGASNAIACDGVFANVLIYNEAPFLTTSSFGIADAGATITNAGIIVTAYTDTPEEIGLSVNLIIGGVTYNPVSNGYINLLTTTSTAYNLCNTTWSPVINWASVNLSTLQVVVYPGNNLSLDASGRIYIDCVRLAIYYTTPGGGGFNQADLCFKLGF